MFSPPLKKSIVFLKYALKMDLVKGAWFDLYKENISSPELTLNIWSNDACRGYVIMAMQDCGFTHKDISRVVNQLYGVFDLYTLNEAEQKYYNGDY